MHGANQKLVIIGASGQLGQELKKLTSGRFLTHEDIEITKTIKPISGDVVINLAAYHNVNQCEKNPKKAFAVNALGAYNVAKASRVVVFISTDYVFDGRKKSSYLETDIPDPLNIYGASKLAGENLIRVINPKHFIIRTSALYGGVSRKGWTFPGLMLEKARQDEEIKVVDDLFTATTYAPDLAKEILKLIKTKKYGTYHIVNKGGISWYQFAQEIFRLKKLRPDFRPVSYKSFASLVARPERSVLASKKIILRSWKRALADYLTYKI